MSENRKISRSKHLILVCSFTTTVWFLATLVMLAVSILSVTPFYPWTGYVFAAFFWIYMFSIPFGILFGLVINRYVLVRVSQPGDRKISLSRITKSGRKFVAAALICILVLFPAGLFGVICYYFERYSGFFYEAGAISHLRYLHKTEEAYFKMHGKYGNYKDLVLSGLYTPPGDDPIFHYTYNIEADKRSWTCFARFYDGGILWVKPGDCPCFR